MRRPVGAHGAQERLQHAPPHAGRPPSRTPPSLMPPSVMPASNVVPAQSMPSTRPQLAPVVGGAPQMPSVWFEFLVHTAEQQSAPELHASPVCPQNDDAWQVPFEAQKPEQHWVG